MDDFIRRIKEQQDMMQRLADGPLRYLRENEALVAQVQQLVRRVDTSVLDSPIAAAYTHGIASRLPAFADSAAAAIARLQTSDLLPAMDRYARECVETTERLALPHRAWTSQITAMSSYIEATRLAVTTIDFEQVGSLIAAADAQSALVAQLTDRLLFQHADLIESFTRPGTHLASLPLSVSDLPTLDVFVHSAAVRSITPHELLDEGDEQRAVPLRLSTVTETVTVLEQTLPELKPAFLVQYRGVKARAADRGPDGWTQGSASMRKLLKGVLHTSAPNELVLPWATKNHKELDKHGRPTRATKVEWLCQSIPNAAYRAYMRTELTSALALIELIDTAQHVDDFSDFQEQYDWIMLRAEVAIRHLLALWKLTR